MQLEWSGGQSHPAGTFCHCGIAGVRFLAASCPLWSFHDLELSGDHLGTFDPMTANVCRLKSQSQPAYCLAKRKIWLSFKQFNFFIFFLRLQGTRCVGVRTSSFWTDGSPLTASPEWCQCCQDPKLRPLEQPSEENLIWETLAGLRVAPSQMMDEQEVFRCKELSCSGLSTCDEAVLQGSVLPHD